MWLPGGPGWSVLYDALKQAGPFRIDHDNANKTVIKNIYSFNSIADILFI